jgi:hypothetical protein
MSDTETAAGVEAATTVTNPVKTHVKDPRRVEAGKRLAKISQEAKARKRAAREAESVQVSAGEPQAEDVPYDNLSYGNVLTLERAAAVIGIAVGLGTLYTMWQHSNDQPKEGSDNNPPQTVHLPPPTPVRRQPTTRIQEPDLFD